MERNVVQAEYFLVNMGDSVSFDALMRDCAARAFDNLGPAMKGARVGTGIKICVRFYDQAGSLTERVSKLESLDDRIEQTFTRFLESGGPRSLWSQFRCWQLTRRKCAALVALKDALLEHLKDAVRTGLPVAIEATGHAFRPLERDESHETIEAVRKSHGLWVFVFKPNDLCADKNEIITSVL